MSSLMEGSLFPFQKARSVLDQSCAILSLSSDKFATPAKERYFCVLKSEKIKHTLLFAIISTSFVALESVKKQIAFS